VLAAAAPKREFAHVTGYVAAFAKTGDPNRSGLPCCPRYDATKSELMMFRPDAAAIMQADSWKSRLDPIHRVVETKPPPRRALSGKGGRRHRKDRQIEIFLRHYDRLGALRSTDGVVASG
jgi:hypothetical protein